VYARTCKNGRPPVPREACFGGRTQFAGRSIWRKYSRLVDYGRGLRHRTLRWQGCQNLPCLRGRCAAVSGQQAEDVLLHAMQPGCASWVAHPPPAAEHLRQVRRTRQLPWPRPPIGNPLPGVPRVVLSACDFAESRMRAMRGVVRVGPRAAVLLEAVSIRRQRQCLRRSCALRAVRRAVQGYQKTKAVLLAKVRHDSAEVSMSLLRSNIPTQALFERRLLGAEKILLPRLCLRRQAAKVAVRCASA
jgi:hypothetical protein